MTRLGWHAFASESMAPTHQTWNRMGVSLAGGS
jgi:hypothetical protein